MVQSRLELAASFDSSELHSAPQSGADFSYKRIKIVKIAPGDGLRIPLPLIPSEDYQRYRKRTPGLGKHHEYFLPGTNKFNTLGGVALKNSRVFWVESSIHNQTDKSFHSYYNQQQGPTTEEGQFQALALSIAGYLPISGVDLWTGVPLIRRIEDGERAIINARDESDNHYLNRYYSSQEIRPFLHKYISGQDLSRADPRVSLEFMSTPQLSRVADLGHELLSLAVRTATEPIEPSYAHARQAGLLHPDAPEFAADLILKSLGREEKKEEIFPAIQLNLRKAESGKTLQTGVDEVQLAA